MLGAEEDEHEGNQPDDKPVALLRRGRVGFLLQRFDEVPRAGQSEAEAEGYVAIGNRGEADQE